MLFHKALLTEGARGALHPDVQQAVLSDKHRIVGVILNAIDDELSGAEQLHRPWNLDAIRPLGALLRAAREGGRIVVLASDHGHIWHHQDSVYRKVADSGERWRPANGKPEPGEILIDGPRVRAGGDSPKIIVPWDENTRYGITKKGYHGGVSPQEMLAPLIILAPVSSLPRKGLIACKLQSPAWWDEPLPEPIMPPTMLFPPIRPTGGSTTLFDHLQEEIVAEGKNEVPQRELEAWSGKLLRSAVYEAQRKLVQKHLPEDTAVGCCLELLDRQGGTMTLAALATQAGILPLRLDGFLAKLQRLLNVDGYEVLRVDRTQDRVTLNVALLCRQFELE
jgi:hypothetical protein